MCWHTFFLINCFGIEIVLRDLYLKRFDLTKGLLFKTFVNNFHNYYLVQIVSLWSLSIGVQTIFTSNKLVDRIKNLKWNASPNDLEEDFLWKECAAGQIFNEIKCAAGKTYQRPYEASFKWQPLCQIKPLEIQIALHICNSKIIY